MIIFSLIENDEDRDYIKDLYLKFYPIMMRIITKMVFDKSIADDLVNNTVIKLIQNINTVRKLDDKAKITYICIAAKNIVLDYMKKQERCEYWATFDEFPELTQTLETKAEQKLDIKELLILLTNVIGFSFSIVIIWI